MTKDEYMEKKRAVAKKRRREDLTLAKEYAFSNSTVKVGDIVTDHMGKVKVENIKFSVGSIADMFPCCIYIGVEITKQGKPFKSGSIRSVYHSNLKEVL